MTTRGSPPPRALVISGRIPEARFLTRCVAAEGYAAVVAQHLTEARELPEAATFALILLDAATIADEPVDACRELRVRATDAAILVLLDGQTSSDCARVLDAGADGCLPRPFDVRELAARVRSLTRRGDYHAVLSVEGVVIDRVARTASVAGSPVHLTPRERELLVYLMRNAGQTVTRERLLLEAFGSTDGKPRSVDAWINHLRSKLGPWGGRIQSVRGVGYRFAWTPPDEQEPCG